MTYKTIGDLVDAVTKRANEPPSDCERCGSGYWPVRASYDRLCEPCAALVCGWVVGQGPPSECAKCGVRYWRTQTFDDMCGPCSGASRNAASNTIVVAPNPYLHNPRDTAKRIRERLRDELKHAAALADIPHRRAIHCRHCDRHHEAELKQFSAQDGALYECECPGTGRAVRQWVSAEEMWG